MDSSEMIQQPDPHSAALRIVERSVFVRWPARVMDRLTASLRSSVVRPHIQSIAAVWRGVERATRLRAVGIMLIAATIAHVAVTALQRVPPGWMWLVIPGIAAAQGIVLVVAGSAMRDTR
jgi:hypothetical protein